MTRILLCPSAYYPSLGGVEEIARNLAKSLSNDGFEVAIAVNRHPKTLPEFEIIDGIEINRFPFEYPNRSVSGLAPLLRFPFNAWKFISFVRKYAPDVVHVICPSSNSLYCYLAKTILNVRVIVTLQGEFFMDANAIYQKSKFACFGAQKLLGCADAVTACSHYVMNDAKKRFEFGAAVENVVFNGVDLNEIACSNGLELPRNPFIFGIGRLVENKGFEVMVRAFAKLSAENSSVDLVIAGAGPLGDELNKLSASLGLEGRVHFVGRQGRAAVAHLFERCLFFVLPSPVEPFGIVCLEAMRAGKAVIANNSGGPAEFIQDGITGLLVSANNVELLFQAMNRLCTDHDLLKILGINGLGIISDFDWSKITGKYKDLYELIV